MKTLLYTIYFSLSLAFTLNAQPVARNYFIQLETTINSSGIEKFSKIHRAFVGINGMFFMKNSLAIGVGAVTNIYKNEFISNNLVNKGNLWNFSVSLNKWMELPVWKGHLFLVPNVGLNTAVSRVERSESNLLPAETLKSLDFATTIGANAVAVIHPRFAITLNLGTLQLKPGSFDGPLLGINQRIGIGLVVGNAFNYLREK
jgi:hypothetical protein